MREILDPRALAVALERGPRMGRGLATLSAAVVLYTASTTYFVLEKLKIRYAAEDIQLPRPPITEPAEAVFVSVLYIGLGFLVVWGIFSIAVYLMGSGKSGLSRLISAVMHSFFALAVASAVLLPLLISSPPVELVIAGAEIHDVKLENVELEGVLASNGSSVSLSAVVLRSPLMVYNSSSPGYPLQIKSATARISEKVEGLGDIYVRRISWERIGFSGYDYRLREDPGRNLYGSVTTLAAWLWINLYVGVVVQRVYGVGRRVSVASALFSLIILLLLGLL